MIAVPKSRQNVSAASAGEIVVPAPFDVLLLQLTAMTNENAATATTTTRRCKGLTGSSCVRMLN